MLERSFEQAYEILIATLKSSEYHWVVDQIQEQIQAGKLVDKEVSRQSIEDAGELELLPTGKSQVSKRRRKGLTTEEYTAEETFNIAVDAIVALAIHTGQIEDALAKFCRTAFPSESDIRFEPDELDTAEGVVFSGRNDRRSVELERLQGLLSKIRDRG